MAHEISIQAGGLNFIIEYRNFGKDRGPAIRVYADIKNQTTQVLRFDCFENDPHYHYDPDGKNEMHHLSLIDTPDTVAWSLEQIRSRTVEMLQKAGYNEKADQINSEEIANSINAMAHAISSLTPH